MPALLSDALSLVSSPRGIAVDATGRVYFTDAGSSTLRSIAPCAFASPTQTPSATLSFGASVSVTPTPTPTVTSTLATGCVVSTVVGSVTGAAGWGDGVVSGTSAQISQPTGLAFNANGTVLYFTERTAASRVRMLTLSTMVLSTLAGSTTGASGNAVGVGTSALLASPLGVGVDASGNVYVADSLNHRIRVITPTGTVATWAGPTSQPGTSSGCSLTGTGTSALFSGPSAVAITRSFVLVANTGCNNIAMIHFSGGSVTAGGGNVSTFAGSPVGASGHFNAQGTSALFYSPRYIVYDNATTSNLFYVSEDVGGRIRVVNASGWVSTLAGPISPVTPPPGFLDGVGTQAWFSNPNGLAVTSSGPILVCDFSNNRVRSITPPGAGGGVVTTIAGSAQGRIDGPAAVSRFWGPIAVAMDPSGAMWVSDRSNNVIRHIVCPVSTPSPTPSALPSPTPSPSVYAVGSCVVTTLAGSPAGAPGWADGVGAAALFSTPVGLALDASGNLFVSESSNRIRRVTPGGVVTTIAGSGAAGSADGIGGAASFNGPLFLSFDASSGMLYGARGAGWFARPRFSFDTRCSSGKSRAGVVSEVPY